MATGRNRGGVRRSSRTRMGGPLPPAQPTVAERPTSRRVGVLAGSDYAEHRKFSIIHEDPAAMEKLRAETLDDLEQAATEPRGPRDFGRGSMDAAVHKSFFVDSVSRIPDQFAAVPKRRRVHLQSADLFECYSPVQKDRLGMRLEQPDAFRHGRVKIIGAQLPEMKVYDQEDIQKHLPNISGLQIVEFVAEQADQSASLDELSLEEPGPISEPVNVGIVLSGGPAPGGHNVIAGVYDYLKSVNSEARVLGFKGGLDGLFKCDFKEITDDLMNRFRNTGGFDMIWSGRGKVTDEEKPQVKKTLTDFNLNGLIIVGGDGSNSNAALLAEYAAVEIPSVSVVGVPKTIDGDLKNEAIECSFGFDTAAKTYSESIGNLCMDCSVGQGVWHFVRVMGRSASHLVMECAMQTRPNLVIIGEEVEKRGTSLKEIVTEIVDVIESRWRRNKRYGVILVPEGLIEFIPEFKVLLAELNTLLSKKPGSATVDETLLSPESRELWTCLPADDRMNLMAEREASGYVQVAKIATERLLLHCAEDVLRKRDIVPVKSFNKMPHYFGYEGRCAMPSNFDAEYCYALGRTAGALVHQRKNGYMAVVKNLRAPTHQWRAMGVPFTMLMGMVKLAVGLRPGIKRQLVDIQSEAFNVFTEARKCWKFDDYYRCPGPIQFTGEISKLRNYVVDPPVTKETLLAGPPGANAELQLQGRAIVGQRYGCYSELQKERIRSMPQVPALCLSKNVICQRGIQSTPQDPYVRRQIYLSLTSLCKSNDFYLREFSPAAPIAGSMDQEDTPVNDSRRRIESGTPMTLGGSQLRKESGLRRQSSLYNPQLDIVGGGKYCSGKTKIGVVFLSRQAPGIQNILWGCYERCKINGGVCYGFKGVEGLLTKDYLEITDEDLKLFRNLGGSSLIGRGIEHLLMEEEKWREVERVVEEMELNGLVLVGSSLAVTEASYLADYFIRRNVRCRVIGVPATASNNLGGDLIEANVGFDTASKLYSSLIGNVLTDAASMPKYWHFIRLMGRQPSNEVLECALQTHPNVVIVAEEYGAAQRTLQDVVNDIADVVCLRANSEESKRNFGAVIIPDGLWHHLPTVKMAMADVDKAITTATRQGLEQQAINWFMDLNEGEASTNSAGAAWQSSFSSLSRAVWLTLPPYIRQELLSADKELRFTYVETERLLAQMVAEELRKRKTAGEYHGGFQCVCHYFGYQGRSAMPSIFDATLGFVHGHLAVMCVEAGITAHLTTVRGLCGRVSSWKLGAIPFNCLLTLVPSQQTVNLHPKLARRERAEMPVVANAEINLNGKAFRWLKIARETWQMQDRFCNPGPIQFCGPAASYYHRILHEEQAEYSQMLQHTRKYATMLKAACDFGVDESYLKFVFTSLHGLLFLRHHPDNLVEDIGQIRPRHHPGPHAVVSFEADPGRGEDSESVETDRGGAAEEEEDF